MTSETTVQPVPKRNETGSSALLLILLLAAGAGAYFLWPAAAKEQPTNQPETPITEQPEPDNPPKPVEGEVPELPEVVKPATSDPAKLMTYPDGTAVEKLNGCDLPVTVNWPRGRPYSPIISKGVEPNGFEWYHHADGAVSSSRIMIVHGKREGVWVFGEQVPFSPLHPSEQPKGTGTPPAGGDGG